ncbi:MAG: metal-sulfur cluster assembly factor [candidate division NC10 bacterium]|nr:metal-sulfur cluster assembly factor [candidate division NC10 bacterium]
MTQTGTPPVTEERIYDALRQILDPELGINLVDLGLIYDVQIRDGEVAIRMTLTTRGCPLHGSIVQAVERVVRQLAGVSAAHAEVVWEPRWNPDRISPDGKQALAGTGRRSPA